VLVPVLVPAPGHHIVGVARCRQSVPVPSPGLQRKTVAQCSFLFLYICTESGEEPVPVPVSLRKGCLKKNVKLATLPVKSKSAECKTIIFTTYYQGMDVDGQTDQSHSEAAARAAAQALASAIQQRAGTASSAPLHQPPPPPVQQPPASEEKVKNDFSTGSLFKQCSAAKLADRNVTISTSASVATGFVSENITVPRIGSMTPSGFENLSNVFHGARLMRGGKQTNEVITVSFDPGTLNCVSCPKSHSILQKNAPSVICLSDQNFLPAMPSAEAGKGCLAIVRLEDASLLDLAGLAIEIFEKSNLNPGSVFLIGSASHLIKVGVTTYTADWVNLCRKLGCKFKNANVCPLVPLLLEDCPGALARDLEVLAIWILKSYQSSIKGFLDAWSYLLRYVQSSAIGATILQYEDIQKYTLPKDCSSPGTDVFFFKFGNSCPAHLKKMDRKAISELLGLLTNLLLSKFSISVSSEVNLPRATPEAGEPQIRKHIVCIGSSIAKQTIPFLQALGHTVTDLTKPGWLATDDNIAALIDTLSKLDIAPGFAVLLDLVGNATHRFVQFDGTMALPQKENGRYHIRGPVACCTDDIFRKIVKSLAPVMLSSQETIKISIPPLPRYVFNSCCNNPTHCANMLEEGHAEKMINSVTHLRNVLKKESNLMGVRNNWILDGVGAICGIPVGKSGGSNKELLPELQNVLATDGVHLKPSGYRNLASAIVSAIEGVKSGSLTKPAAVLPVSEGGRSQREYFWKGFLSPVGDCTGRAMLSRNHHTPNYTPNYGPLHHRGRPRNFSHPYRKNY
jgi:hypothetical protein